MKGGEALLQDPLCGIKELNISGGMCSGVYPSSSMEYALEEGVYLHTNNVTEMFLLHYVFLPRINFALDEFCSASNLRPVRTEHNWSPNRMWANGMINRHYTGPTSNEPTPSNMEYYGNDPEGPTPLEEHGSVVVDDIFNPLDENVFEEFGHLVNPLAESESFGIDIYSYFN